jgi:protein gp37
MAQTTGISWTNATWNPTVGCSKVSTGCRECYAEDLHETRLNGVHGYPVFKPWTTANAEHNVTLMPHKLRVPLTWRKPRMVFVNSMSDLFHEQISGVYIAKVFATMMVARRHTFQVLTKRPERMAAMLGDEFREIVFRRAWEMCEELDLTLTYVWPLPNVWLGVSIENRQWVGRADVLRQTPAAVRFISAEPLLGDLTDQTLCPPGSGAGCWDCGQRGMVRGPDALDLTGIDWLILGGESGSGHRPLDVQWMRDLRDAARATTIGDERPDCALFVKQLGGARPGTALEDLPEDLRIREFPR